VREVEIWKDLKHENVLELYGASSAQGDPPWFFVSPYASNGSLVEYLKRDGKSKERGVGLGLTTALLPENDADKEWRRSKAQTIDKGDNLFRFMWEIAKGMEYLHENGVLHGDLKVGFIPNQLFQNQLFMWYDFRLRIFSWTMTIAASLRISDKAK